MYFTANRVDFYVSDLQHPRMAQPPRIKVTTEQIETVVAKFYAAIRADTVLGPIFAAHVPSDGWPAHEDKIARFWRNVVLRQRVYDGNPMQAHMAAGNVRAEHFPRWLALFDKILASELTEDAAQDFSTLAHRIAHGLRLGVEDLHAPADAPPSL